MPSQQASRARSSTSDLYLDIPVGNDDIAGGGDREWSLTGFLSPVCVSVMPVGSCFEEYSLWFLNTYYRILIIDGSTEDIDQLSFSISQTDIT